MAFMDDLVSVMAQASTPQTPGFDVSANTSGGSTLGKRTASDADLGSDTDEDSFRSSPAPSVTPRAINQNLVTVAKRIGAQKKLKVEQLRELQDFAGDTLGVHNVKLYAKLFAIENKLEKIITSTPPFEVSKALSRNILSYCMAVFFSSKLAAYKGHIPRNHVLDIIRRLRFDMPVGIEGLPAEWAKVKTCVQDTLTQIRGAVKKLLKKSIVSTTDTKKNMSIYEIATKVVQKTTLKVSIPLMARLALMRGVFMESSDENFWNHVDTHLALLRSHAGTPEQLVLAFKHALKKDREIHGLSSTEYEVDNGEGPVDDIQQNADDAIDEANRVADAARIAAATATPAASKSNEVDGEEASPSQA